MPVKPKASIAGVILAGGASRRMGAEKAFVMLGGRPLIAWAIGNLQPQVGAISINANDDSGRMRAFGLPVIADELAMGEGPAAGLHSALQWAATAEANWLVTAPVDTPFLPRDFVERIFAGVSRNAARAAIAVTRDEMHPTVGIWQVSLRPIVTELIHARGLRALHEIATALSAARVAFDDAALFNVNTPADLREAEALLAREIAGKTGNLAPR